MSTEQPANTEKYFASMTAREFCKLAVDVFYADKPDEYLLSLGHWYTPEPDPAKMTIYTLPRFEADMSVTVGELRRMAVDAR